MVPSKMYSIASKYNSYDPRDSIRQHSNSKAIAEIQNTQEYSKVLVVTRT